MYKWSHQQLYYTEHPARSSHTNIIRPRRGQTTGVVSDARSLHQSNTVMHVHSSTLLALSTSFVVQVVDNTACAAVHRTSVRWQEQGRALPQMATSGRRQHCLRCSAPYQCSMAGAGSNAASDGDIRSSTTLPALQCTVPVFDGRSRVERGLRWRHQVVDNTACAAVHRTSVRWQEQGRSRPQMATAG